jgi:hypothetical protein
MLICPGSKLLLLIYFVLSLSEVALASASPQSASVTMSGETAEESHQGLK